MGGSRLSRTQSSCLWAPRLQKWRSWGNNECCEVLMSSLIAAYLSSFKGSRCCLEWIMGMNFNSCRIKLNILKSLQSDNYCISKVSLVLIMLFRTQFKRNISALPVSCRVDKCEGVPFWAETIWFPTGATRAIYTSPNHLTCQQVLAMPRTVGSRYLRYMTCLWYMTHCRYITLSLSKIRIRMKKRIIQTFMQVSLHVP